MERNTFEDFIVIVISIVFVVVNLAQFKLSHLEICLLKKITMSLTFIVVGRTAGRLSEVISDCSDCTEHPLHNFLIF